MVEEKEYTTETESFRESMKILMEYIDNNHVGEHSVLKRKRKTRQTIEYEGDYYD